MNSTKLIFKNDGILDIEAITTFGVSSKASTNAIGYFGTGLKYAIAILLRNGQKITIHTGGKTYKFTSNPKKIRFDTFDIVYMNETPLGFTTDLGKTWELWQAYRELYCNCLDESGTTYTSDSADNKSSENETLVIVEGIEILEVHEDKSNFILGGTPIYKTPMLEIYPGKSKHLYFKGIRVYDLNSHSDYTYNFLREVKLSEDRNVSNYWALKSFLAETLGQLTSKNLIKGIIFATKDSYENSLEFLSRFSPAFEKIAIESIRARRPGMNKSIRTFLYQTKPDLEENMYEVLDLNMIQQKTLQKGISFCKKINYYVDDYKIVPVKDLGNCVLGLAKNETIYLSELAFMQGTKFIASTLIEEYFHLKYRLHDETREMQTFLFDTIVSLGELLIDESL